MIKSLLLTLSCVIGSGSGALQKNAPTFNNEPPQKNLIDKTTDDPYDYYYIDPLKTDSKVNNDYNKVKNFYSNTLKINENRRVAKITENKNINGTLIYSTLISMTYREPSSNGRLFQADSTLIISYKRKAIAQEIRLATHNTEIPIFNNNLPSIEYSTESNKINVEFYTYSGLANNDVRNGIGYESYYWYNNLVTGQIDPNIKQNTLRLKYSLMTTQHGGSDHTTYNYEYWNPNTQTNQTSSWVFTQNQNGAGILTKNTYNYPVLTSIGDQNEWQTFILHFSARTLYDENRVFNLPGQDVQLNNYCATIENTVLRADIVAPSGTTINYEVVEVAPMFWQILTMPFTFIATAFNFSFFEGTIYEINPATILLAVISALVIAWILKKMISRS